MTAVLVSGGNSVGDFHGLVWARWAGETTEADDGVVREMHDGKTVRPRVGCSRLIQSFEELRGYFRAREEVPDALSDPDAESLLVRVGSLKKCA
jgi:hypothetical protein